MDYRELAERIFRAMKTGQPIDPPSETIEGFDLTQATRCQEALIQLLMKDGRRVAGGKIGLSDPRARAAMGIEDPFSGLLFENMKLGSGATIPAGSYRFPRIEAEICLVLDRTLDDPDLTEAQAAEAVAQILPSIEVVDTWFAPPTRAIPDAIAENISAAYFVCGKPVRDADLQALADCRVSILLDGEEKAQGTGDVTMGGPLKALHWVARDLARRGWPLEAGAHVMSGTLAPMMPVAAGQTAVVDFGPLGRAEVTFGT